MKRGYNPYLLPDWLRRTRFYVKGIIIPIGCFQLVRVLIVPTTWDFLLLVFLAFLGFLLFKDII
ncbi:MULTISPECIES: hypothetical protein [unclassified Psychrobacillus]|uniref:hypothetical protein n=1 Tax=unclassified Psychrobacillus TaxID=2636677 RepID=UPI00146F1C8A|nr:MULTISPECIES: hypothetical protein [unclassified Psychrobacillus]MCM3357805.1 hypothetical protein [Psychrobacillus sp. MER TA 171]NME06153.1 hypothetical protein [Psychrobacillus sp. BL-248-WT-3]